MSISEIELELAKINNQLLKRRATISLKEINDLFLKSKGAVKRVKDEGLAMTKKIEEEMMNIFLKVVALICNFGEKWEKGEFSPNDEELSIIENIVNDSEKISDSEYMENRKEFSEEDVSKFRSEAKRLKEKVQEEKSRRQDNKDKGGGNQPPPPSNNNAELDKQITNLQSQIKALEDKIKNTPASDNSQQKKEFQQQIERLKNELKEKEKEKNQQQSIKNDKNDFPWGIVIVSGVVIFILLIVIIFLLTRNNKNK